MSGGRPRASAEGWEAHNKRASFYLSLELLSTLDEYARTTGASKSEIVRDALLAYIKPASSQRSVPGGS